MSVYLSTERERFVDTPDDWDEVLAKIRERRSVSHVYEVDEPALKELEAVLSAASRMTWLDVAKDLVRFLAPGIALLAALIVIRYLLK